VCASTRAAPGVRCRRCEGFRFGSVRVRCDAMSRHEAPNPTEAVRCGASLRRNSAGGLVFFFCWNSSKRQDARPAGDGFVSFSFRFVSLHGASDRTHTAQHPPRSPAACARHGVAACCLGEHAAAPPQSIETKRNETKQRKSTQHNTTQHKTTLSTPRPAVVILEFN